MKTRKRKKAMVLAFESSLSARRQDEVLKIDEDRVSAYLEREECLPDHAGPDDVLMTHRRPNGCEICKRGKNGLLNVYDDQGRWLGYTDDVGDAVTSADTKQLLNFSGGDNLTEDALWVLWNSGVRSGVRVMESLNASAQMMFLPEGETFLVASKVLDKWDICCLPHEVIVDRYCDAGTECSRLRICDDPYMRLR